MSSYNDDQGDVVKSEPAFNVPAIVLGLLGCFIAVHLVRQFLTATWDDWFVLEFAFSAARISPPPEFADVVLPGGAGAQVWTFFSHMFLHGDWGHLLINGFWMLAFGSVLARRIGAMRFLVFSLVTAAFGALGNLLVYWGQFGLLIGASGAISGQMAGTIRLMFSVPGGLSNLKGGDFSAVKVVPLHKLLNSRNALVFISVWLVVNFVVGISGLGTGDHVSRIAWEAHLGGFVSGLLLFTLFDRKSQ